MILETERLILRPWRISDADSLYLYASDERVGPPAGWPPHNSVAESKEIIRTVFSQDGVFAVTLKGRDTAIGCIGLIRGAASNLPIGDNEGEISYWIGVPFWGQGLIPEAMREIIRYGFEELALKNLWCGYFDGNEKSRRAQEKCGFRHHHTNPEQYYPLIQDCRVEHISRLTKDEWLNGQ
ncbi:MAG: GNAT family N-acetyltransferase [Muribaculaceae bacterium]|nr:GNAT family N-acetyltransferase [Muribaculaceae bacterium]MDE6526835.1 GNAT family N-acetyltransferase [Muribaculaceae bacterium]